jgi:hypothetical protein
LVNPSQLVLAQTKVPNKSNEITAIPILLDILDIEGSIITIDAMGAQKKIAAHIQQGKGDYILSLKPIILLYSRCEYWLIPFNVKLHISRSP